jgi:phage terminase small subunit
MPRQPQLTLSVAHIGPGAQRLAPPAELGKIEAAIFKQVVASVPYEHFCAENVALLCAYSRAMALERRASEELAASAVVGRAPSPWVAVHSAAIRSISTLAVRLRIGPKSRHPNNTRRMSKPSSPPLRPALRHRGRVTERSARMVTTRLSAIDRDALTRALALAKASDEPGRREQIPRMLQHKTWQDVAEFAAYGCQRRALQLKPWQNPPCYGQLRTDDADNAGAAVLLQRLLEAGLSRWEPDPVAALAAIETRAHGDLPPAA